MPGATGSFAPTPKRSLADRLDDAAAGMLPMETPGSHFARPAERDDNPKVAHPAPFAKTARDEVKPQMSASVADKYDQIATRYRKVVARRTTRSRR